MSSQEPGASGNVFYALSIASTRHGAHNGRVIARMLGVLLTVFLVVGGAPQERSTDGAIVRGPTAAKRIALIFTGHEYAEGADAILAALDRRAARASFFLTGDFLRRPGFAPIVRRMAARGHYVGPHSDKHLLYCEWQPPKRTLLSREAYRKDIEDNLRELQRFGIARPRFFLPAYEWLNAEVAAWTVELGLTPVNFTPGTRANADYTENTAPNFVSSDRIVESILEREQRDPHGLNGFLLLMHVGAGTKRTDKLHDRLDGLLGTLQARGYKFVRIDDLLAAIERRPYTASIVDGGFVAML